MAFKKCPGCGNLINSEADRCGYCGFNLAASVGVKQIIDDMFRQYVNSPHNVLEGYFRKDTLIIVKYLNSLYDGQTASEIYMAFVSKCFAADGVLSIEEYKLLSDMLSNERKNTFTYEACVAFVQNNLDNGVDEMEKIIDDAPPSVVHAAAELCMAIAAIDGRITPSETNFCLKYVVKAFSKLK